MELIERYLHAIRPWLPLGSPRDEILRELSEDIRSEVDERRGDRTEIPEPELVAILKARGHPVAVAARFGPGDALVGPRLYPIFRLVVRIAVGYVLLPVLAVVCVFAALRSSHPFGTGIESLLSSVQVVFTMLGVVVTVFAILERYAKDTELAVEWDPRRLPRVRKDGEEHRCHAWGVAIGNVVLAILFASFALRYPLLLPGIENLMLGGALPGPAMSAMLDSTWRLVVALALVNAAAASAMLVRPEMARASTLVIASATALLGAVMITASMPHWDAVLQVATLGEGMRAVKAAGPSIDARQLGMLLGPAFDAIAVLFFLGWGAGCLVSALVEAWRYAKL